MSWSDSVRAETISFISAILPIGTWATVCPVRQVLHQGVENQQVTRAAVPCRSDEALAGLNPWSTTALATTSQSLSDQHVLHTCGARLRFFVPRGAAGGVLGDDRVGTLGPGPRCL
jgi:hypothetical protein